MFKLDLERKNDPNFLEDLAIISCELLLAYEELSSFNETLKISPNTDPKAHFMTQKQTNQYPNKNPTFNNPPQPNYPGPDNPNYYPTPEFNQSGPPVVPPRPGQSGPNPNT